jgi:hypothetical protein
MPEVVDKGEL